MTTIKEDLQLNEDIKALVVSVSTGVDALLAQIAALTAQVAAGSVATQADLDALGVSGQAIKDSLTGVVAKEPAPAA